MRSVIFRAKRLDTNEWAYGTYAFLPKRKGTFGQTISDLDRDRYVIVDEFGHVHEINPETLGQYTTLRDKRGTRIFESDILLLTADNGDIIEAEVHFGEYCLEDDDEAEGHIGFYLSVKADDETYNFGLAQIRVYRNYVDVVGNIYDK